MRIFKNALEKTASICYHIIKSRIAPTQKKRGKIMIDTTVPNGKVIMIKHDADTYPRYSLPDGFYITGYKPGLEIEWAEIELEQQNLAPIEKGLETFRTTFMTNPEWLSDRCLFIIDEKNGKAAAVISLWKGNLGNDTPKNRIHWVATREEYQGLGLIKAAFTYIMDLYHRLGETGYIYLTTQTGSYKAINIYKKFGFVEYMGEYSNSFDQEKNAWAWKIINEKIDEYKVKRAEK